MNNYSNRFQQQQGFYNPGFQQQGVGYAVPRRQPNYTQPLDIETIRKMKGGQNKKFTTAITAEEQHRAICTHKDPDRNNEFSLIDESDGSSTCYICGANFHITEYTKEEVETAVNNVLEIMQNIKTVYLDIPMNVAKEYMTMMVFLERIPELYEIAYNNFDSHDRSVHYGQNTNTFGVFNALMSPGFGVGGMTQYGTYPQQMQYNQPQMGYPQGNPFVDYGQQQQYPQQNMQQQQQPNQGMPGAPNQDVRAPHSTNMPNNSNNNNQQQGYQGVEINPGVFNV